MLYQVRMKDGEIKKSRPLCRVYLKVTYEVSVTQVVSGTS